MSYFFRKTIKLGPVNINFSKSGIGISIGIPGARIGKTANGQTFVHGNLPGTGLGYRKIIKGKNNKGLLG